jgi:hypothetical protein
MNVIKMICEIICIANPVVGKSALPHFGLSPTKSAERMGVSALD